MRRPPWAHRTPPSPLACRSASLGHLLLPALSLAPVLGARRLVRAPHSCCSSPAAAMASRPASCTSMRRGQARQALRSRPRRRRRRKDSAGLGAIPRDRMRRLMMRQPSGSAVVAHRPACPGSLRQRISSHSTQFHPIMGHKHPQRRFIRAREVGSTGAERPNGCLQSFTHAPGLRLREFHIQQPDARFAGDLMCSNQKHTLVATHHSAPQYHVDRVNVEATWCMLCIAIDSTLPATQLANQQLADGAGLTVQGGLRP